MSEKGHGRNWAARTAVLLFFLALYTAFLTAGMYAKYTASTRGSDGARVAAFVLDGKAESLTVNLEKLKKPGDSQHIDIMVSNHRGSIISEVAEAYTITVRELGSLPLTCTLTPAGESAKADITAKELAKNGTFAAAVAGEQTYRLTVTWPAGETSPKYAGGTASLRVTILGEQID